MIYMAKGYKLNTGKIQEGRLYKSFSQALHESLEMLHSEQYKVIVILADSEGEDHPDNAGKFFLNRIIK